MDGYFINTPLNNNKIIINLDFMYYRNILEFCIFKKNSPIFSLNDIHCQSSQ